MSKAYAAVEQRNDSPAAPPAGPKVAIQDDLIPTSEREILVQLRDRRKIIEQREKEYEEKKQLLAAAQNKIDDKVHQLAKLQSMLEKLETTRHEHDEENWRGLVKTYENMRPRDAALIMNELDSQIMLQVLDRMKENKTALILAAMAPERARVATTELARMRSRSVTLSGQN